MSDLPQRRRAVILAFGAFAVAALAGGLTLALVPGQKHAPVRRAPVVKARAAKKVSRRARAATAARRLKREERAALVQMKRTGRSVYCGGRRGHFVALTFDDGPGPYTMLALRILRHSGARATFFLVGKELRYWPGVPAQELQLGALGDHTWTHVVLPVLTSAEIVQQLRSTKLAIQEETHSRVELFRPPYGADDLRVERSARSLGLVDVLWSIDSRDSEGADWRQIAANVERFVRPGSIILMHENRGQTIRALRRAILPFLHAHDLVPVTVPELLALDPPTPAQLAAGINGCYPRGAPRPGRTRTGA